VRIEFVLWVGVTVHFAGVGLLYALVGDDPAGTALLLIAAGLGGLVAGWTWDWRRQHQLERPEDRLDADAVDEIGIVGVYPTASLRPLALAVGMSAVVLGVVVGSWMVIAGAAIVASQVALLVRDADR
jgi:Cytochrome c oxidase subunit IV